MSKDSPNKPSTKLTPTPPAVAQDTAPAAQANPSATTEAPAATTKSAKGASKPYSLVLPVDVMAKASVYAKLTSTSVSALVTEFLSEIVRTKLRAEIAKISDEG